MHSLAYIFVYISPLEELTPKNNVSLLTPSRSSYVSSAFSPMSASVAINVAMIVLGRVSLSMWTVEMSGHTGGLSLISLT